MAKGKSNHSKMGAETSRPLSTYELMGQRINKEIMSPRAQRDAHVIIDKHLNDSWDDWDRFVEEIQTEETLTLRELEPGKVELRWIKFKADSTTSSA